VLIDHDRVEERNLIRQCFLKNDLGFFKSEVLAKRLAQNYRRPIAYSTLPVGMTEIIYPGLIIGCVDNGPARREIAERIERKALVWVGGYSQAAPRELQSGPRLETALWWVDAGNGENYG
jgi:molybdopterin/thiamine biosynthesis adenylyltransferase